MKRQYIYPSIDDSEVVLVLNVMFAGLKELSQVLSEQTLIRISRTVLRLSYDSPATLNNIYFSFSIFRSGLSDMMIRCNRISEDLIYGFTALC
jgi:hypothetical protein